MDGIFIPMEFQILEGLTNTESMVLAIYKYYTEKGNLHYCSLKNEDICKMVRLKNESNLIRIKKHLKKLGYIRTDGGIRVYYLGVNPDIKVTPDTEVNPDIKVTQPRHISQSGVTYKSVNPDIKVTHNKKEKTEKRNKKVMTNFDLLIDRLPSDYKTPERIDYIKDKYEERLNNTDLIDGAMDSWVTNIKIELNKVYPIEYIIPKQEKKIDTIDVI